MTDEPSSPENEPLPAASEATTILDHQKVLNAVVDPVRRLLLKILSQGTPYDVTALAAKVRRRRDMAAKHLKVLRDCRLILPTKVPGADGRKTFHIVPPVYIKKDAVGRTALDFGSIVLRF